MGIPEEVRIAITDSDAKKMNSLLKRPYVKGNMEMTQQVSEICTSTTLKVKSHTELENYSMPYDKLSPLSSSATVLCYIHTLHTVLFVLAR